MNLPSFPAACLTIGVSDASGASGIQADLKTFTALSCHGASVVTSVAAQSLGKLRDLHLVPTSSVCSQLEAAVADLPVGCVKVGLIHGLESLRAIARWLREHPELKVVIDPVSGDATSVPLQSPEQLKVLREELLPRATVVTPNRQEAALLAGMDEVLDRADMEQAAKILLERHGSPVLVTGGGLGRESLDVLAALDGMRHFSFPTVGKRKALGSGATLSAAIAANLAKGDSVREAVMAAKLYVSAALAAAPILPDGRAVLWHPVTVREQVITGSGG